jgi:hypothetical protein
MDAKRYWMVNGEWSKLTQEELREGWHYCAEWDQMLVGPTMPEWEACLCFKAHD